MGWQGSLALRYRSEDGRTRVHDRHDGPLRVLKSLHPEGDRVCHSVLVHPPGGIVGGDTLAIELALEAGAHALVTTPGATRFYRSLGEPARSRWRSGPRPARGSNGCRSRPSPTAAASPRTGPGSSSRRAPR